MLPGPDILAHCAANSSAAAFAAWIARDDAHAILAEHPAGAAPVGYALLTPPDFPLAPEPGDRELRRIYALGITRGTGLGAALMADALAAARAGGGRRLLLGVRTANARARAFYERQGFAVAGERRFLVGDTWNDDLVYARAL